MAQTNQLALSFGKSSSNADVQPQILPLKIPDTLQLDLSVTTSQFVKQRGALLLCSQYPPPPQIKSVLLILIPGLECVAALLWNTTHCAWLQHCWLDVNCKSKSWESPEYWQRVIRNTGRAAFLI